MVFFPAVQAVLNSSEPRPEIENGTTNSSMTSGDNAISTKPDAFRASAGPGPTSSSTSARFAKSTGTMPPPSGPVFRKQNIACDACRSRKIRCQRVSIHQICEQCEARGSECTSHYVEQLANKQTKKKSGVKRRRKSGDEGVERASPSRQDSESLSAPTTEATGGYRVDRRDSETTLAQTRSDGLQATTAVESDSSLASTPLSKQNDLLRYLFSPEPVLDLQYGYNDLSSMRQCEMGESDLWEEMGGKVWTEAPGATIASLDQDAMTDLAEDLLDTYFSIVHIRLPLLEPEDFRARFIDPDCHPDGPLYHPLLAVALAWGARFSDHPIINADREETSAQPSGSSMPSQPSRSRMVQMLVIRAREVAEVNKAFRNAKVENVRLAILLEPLLAQAPFLKDRYQEVWVVHATRHFTTLKLNSPSGLLAVADEKKRSEVVYMWWMMCLSDGFRSAFHRLRPATGDGYFDVDLQHQFQATWDLGDKSVAMFSDRGGTSSAGGSVKSTDGPGQDSVAWLRASHDGSTTCRLICDELWVPKVREKGIPIATLRKLLNSISGWRDTHLSKLGVPTKWPEDWDFLATITTCSTDVYCHCLWLVVAGAIRDFGVIEARAIKSPLAYEVEGVLRRCREEADHAAMRIAALAAVLTENGYLRLDPLIIYHPIYEAGLYLAGQGKEECLACVAGLRQYAAPFPSIFPLAHEIEMLYVNTKSRAPQSSLIGVGHLPPFLPPLSSTPNTRTTQSSSAGGTNSSVNTSPMDLQPSTIDWSAQTLDLLAQNSQTFAQFTQTQPEFTLSTNRDGPSNRDVWPDGTPMPSRDIAWNLFDWVHQA